MVPPASPSCTDQVTEASLTPVTLAVNWNAPPVTTPGLAGDTVTTALLPPPLPPQAAERERNAARRRDR